MTNAAIQGTRGSYSEQAARDMLGVSVELLEFGNFAAVFDAVAGGRAKYAVVPLRNKIVGEIQGVADLLIGGKLSLLNEQSLEIRHVLAGTPNASIEDVTNVRSHIEALKQCANFFEINPHLTRRAETDTGSSVRKVVAHGRTENAAIGSKRAAEIYGAKILLEDIADDAENWTVFGLLVKK